jgi:predicted nucleic-acid-binding protein
LRNNFDEIGVHLSSEQIEVLLARVDGDDIIQIALVMETLKQITAQIMQLMKESGEELKQAKKYYGMHQVLLELVVYIQQKYIDKSNTVYLPRIDKIIADSKQMIEDTKRLRDQEEEYSRRAVYAKNIDALELTLKVAKRYREDLLKARNNMIEAQKISLANLKLSKNTYATVSLSADLYTLISESQTMFEEVSKIQVPSIVPFENMQIRQKYLELTDSLQ